MELETIEEGLPEELQSQLTKGEKVYYFSYITYKGGCGSSSSREDYWIALSNKRVLYKAKIMEENDKKIVEKEGVLPLEKVSFIEVTDIKDTTGCATSRVFELRISTSGGTVKIPVPTKEKGNEIRKVFLEVHEHHKNKE